MRKLNISRWLGQSKIKWFIAIYLASVIVYLLAISLSHLIVEVLKA